MLRIASDLSAYTLAAGEPFIMEVQLLASNGAATDIDDHSLVLSFYDGRTRTLIERIEGERLADTTGEYFRWARDGTFSEGLIDQASVTVELARRWTNGRRLMGAGALTIAKSAPTIPSLAGVGIGDTAVRVSIKAGTTLGAPEQISVDYIPYVSSIPATPPSFLTAPSVQHDGTPAVGETLTGVDGTASGGAIASRSWLLNGSAISGATGASYVPTQAGDYRFANVATGPGGSTPATSVAVTVAAAPTPTPAPMPTVTLSAAQSKAEGDSGATVFTYTATRSSGTGAVNVPWSFAAGGTNAADFTGGTLPAGGTIAFADSVTSATFAISVAGDTAVEPDETFTVSITAPAGYAAGAAMSATGTILNDDVAPANPVILAIFAGQSNMDGRAAREAQDNDPGGRIWQIGNYPAEAATFQKVISDISPLLNRQGHDEASAGLRDGWVGPGEYIVRQLAADNATADVVALNASQGSTALVATGHVWQVGDGIYEEMVARANAAIPILQAKFPGRPIQIRFFWVQGEFDDGVSRAAYRTALTNVIADARARITGAANAPWVIGSMLPERWLIGAPNIVQPRAVINAAHVDVSLSVANVRYVMGPNEIGQDGLHYSTAAAVRAFGLAMGAALIDTAVPANPLGTTASSEVGQKLDIPLPGPTYAAPTSGNFNTIAHKTWEIVAGGDAALFELSDPYATVSPAAQPVLRWAGDGTGPVVGSYTVSLRSRSGAGIAGPTVTRTHTVTPAYGTGDQGPITATQRYADRVFKNYYDGPGYSETFPLKAGLNLWMVQAADGGFTGQACTIGGKAATRLVAGTNFEVWAAVVPADDPAGTVAFAFQGYFLNPRIQVIALTGTKVAPASVDIVNWGSKASPLESAAMTVPTNGLAIALGGIDGSLAAGTGTTLLGSATGNAFAGTRSTSGKASFALTNPPRDAALATLVWEKSV